MSPLADRPDVVRLVEGRRGQIAMGMELVIRFDDGSSVPWAQRAPAEQRPTR